MSSTKERVGERNMLMYVLHVIVIWSLLINCTDDRRQGCCSSRCYQNELYVMIVRLKLNVHRHCSNIGSMGKAKEILFSLFPITLSLSLTHLQQRIRAVTVCVLSHILFSSHSRAFLYNRSLIERQCVDVDRCPHPFSSCHTEENIRIDTGDLVHYLLVPYLPSRVVW